MSSDHIGGSNLKLKELLTFLKGYDLDSGNFALKIKDCFLPAVTFTTLLTVTRRWQTANSTISTFESPIIDTGTSCEPSIVSGYMLESKGPASTIKNQNRRIPAGTYHLKWHKSPKFNHKKMPLLYNDQVSESRRILIHNGNYPKDTEGCLLVGSNKALDYVGRSNDTLKEVLTFLKDYDLNSGKFLLKMEENFE